MCGPMGGCVHLSAGLKAGREPPNMDSGNQI